MHIPSDKRWKYVHGVEQAATGLLTMDAGPLDVAHEVWRLRARQEPFDKGWGYHVAPELFLTIAALLDENRALLREFAKPIDWPSLVRFIDGAELLGGDGIFEIGGRFLDLLDPSRQRSYDAEFDHERSIRVDRQSLASTDLKLIFASGLFEESSGIHQTLVDGPASKRDLAPIFAVHGIPIEHYDRYRREQARIASIELFAWARNHLVEGGFLVVNNALSPSVSPFASQLPMLGFDSYATLFVERSQDAAFNTSVSVYRAVEPQLVDAAITEKCEFYSQTTERANRLPMHRLRQWRWLGGRLQATWLEAT